MTRIPPPVRPQLPSKPVLPKPPHTLPPRLPPGIKPSPIDWKKLLGTVSLQDRLVAGRLHQTLGQHVNSLAGALAELKAGNATLKRGADGVMRGPEGQPLVTVKLDGGRTAYVDPNTNQYYLPNDSIRYCRMPGSIQAKGPMTLPKDAQFSNSYFTVAEVKDLNRIANPRIGRIVLDQPSRFEDAKK